MKDYDEFKNITKPVIREFWNRDYFTVPLPEGKKKEFKLDLPAFKKFDIIAMRQDGEDMVVKAIESKRNAEDAIPQARSYQLCIPEVYIASKDDIKDNLMEKLNKYGLGYIMVHESNRFLIKLEPRISPFFNRKYYDEEVLPRIITILAFYEFMNKCLGMERDEIKRNVDLGIQDDYLWISDRVSTNGIQWSLVYDYDSSISFGINLESVSAIGNTFGNKNKQEIQKLFEKFKSLPGNFFIKFERRCEEDADRFKRGKPHVPFKKLNWSRKKARKLTDQDINVMSSKVREDKYVELGIWGEIWRKEEVQSLSIDYLWKRMNYYRKEYLNTFYNDLKS